MSSTPATATNAHSRKRFWSSRLLHVRRAADQPKVARPCRSRSAARTRPARRRRPRRLSGRDIYRPAPVIGRKPGVPHGLLLDLADQHVVDVVLRETLRLALREEVQQAAQRVRRRTSTVSGDGRDAVDRERRTSAVDEPERDVADGARRAGDDGAHLTGARAGRRRVGSNAPPFEHDLRERLARAGRLVAVDEADRQVRAADLASSS